MRKIVHFRRKFAHLHMELRVASMHIWRQDLYFQITGPVTTLDRGSHGGHQGDYMCGGPRQRMAGRYGVPGATTSDRGKQFVSGAWSSTWQRLGEEVKLFTAYHPQDNFLVERLHRHLKDALHARTSIYCVYCLGYVL
jgi:hypothetical protein